jgi:PIN domain nuclease of toxin-antitoxin system
VKLVLDGSAMIAYLQDESGAATVDNLLMDIRNDAAAHVLNLIEVYYEFLRNSSDAEANNRIQELIASGIQPRYDLDMGFWRQVARLKARGRISIADCFCIALAQRLGATVVTSDRHEFEPIEQAGIVPVLFIR